MSQSQDQKKYSHPLKSIFTQNFLKTIVREIKKTKAKKVIDIGCGEGYPDKVILEKIPEVKLLGIDSNKEFIAEAKKKNPQVDYQATDIFKMNFRSQEFDLALVLEVLEHLKEPQEAIIKVKQAAPMGIFSVPYEPWFSFASFASGNYLKTKGRHPEHINLWGKASFEKFLKKHYRQAKVIISFPWLIGVCKDEQ